MPASQSVCKTVRAQHNVAHWNDVLVTKDRYSYFGDIFHEMCGSNYNSEE